VTSIPFLARSGFWALYIRKDLIPEIDTHGVGYGAIEEFNYPDGHKIKTEDIDKFLMGGMSKALRAGFTEGINFVEEIGLREIEARNLALALTLKQGLAAVSGVEVLSPMHGPGCSGIVSFAIAGADHEAAARALWDGYLTMVRNIVYPSCLRASLHFFNTEDEVDKLVYAVRKLIAT
jgi:selenocysteine lyase/cysteine desulfurase